MTTSTQPRVTRPKRKKPGSGATQAFSALRRIRPLEEDWEGDIPFHAFSTVVSAILKEKNHKVTTAGLMSMRAAGEDYLVNVFEVTKLLASHRGRVTVMNKDFELFKRLQKHFCRVTY